MLGELKPILAALVLPPAGLLLLVLAGLLWALRRRAGGLALAALAAIGLMVLSTSGVAVLLARTILPQVTPAQPQALAAVQAIVVLGGGVEPRAPEYGAAQPQPFAYGRIRYGAWLARRTGKPLAYAGGVGWGGLHEQEPEGQVARRVLQEDFGIAARWIEDQSRDTRDNARRLAALMQPEGVRRIALVTDSWHMPRSVHQFEAAGFEVVPAPTNFPSVAERGVLPWLPSARGLLTTSQVVREWIALRVARLP